MSTYLLDRSVRRSFTELCWNVGTPVAYKALKMLEREDWVGLVSIKVTISGYCCPRTLSGDLQVAAFFKKYPGFDLGIDLEQQAVDTFWENERQCYKANESLSPLLEDVKIYGEGVANFINLTRKKVRDVLGRCPRVSELEPRFGPGSTYLNVGPLITVPDKMSESYTLTPGASVCLQAWDSTAWSRYAAANLEKLSLPNNYPFKDGFVGLDEVSPGLGSNFFDDAFAPRSEEYVRGNRFTTVPKDATKLRGICIEPSINLFYQLGVGRWLEQRMGKVWKWTKEFAQDLHRYLALIGSVTGGLATIDLSNASDTICRVLVKLLLPKDWHTLLSSLRSPFTCLKGRWVRLEKFSSMGNGFTFELETLIFRCIAEAVRDITLKGYSPETNFHSDFITTFGDDIIVPTSTAKNVMDALEFLGMKINKNKSFVEGSFRESCGGDYFKGLDMRPHYLKEVPNEPHQYIALANGLRRFGRRHINCGGSPDVIRNSRLRILDNLPSNIRNLSGPESLGDLCVHEEEDKWRPTVRSSIRYFRVWRPVPFGRTSWDHFRPGVVLASALYGVGDGRRQSIGSQEHSLTGTSGVMSSVNRSYVSGYRFGRVAFS